MDNALVVKVLQPGHCVYELYAHNQWGGISENL